MQSLNWRVGVIATIQFIVFILISQEAIFSFALTLSTLLLYLLGNRIRKNKTIIKILLYIFNFYVFIAMLVAMQEMSNLPNYAYLMPFAYLMVDVLFASYDKNESEIDNTVYISPKRFGHGYRAKKNILTDTEKDFYKILKKECDKRNLIVNCKTRLEDIIVSTSKGRKHNSERGKIKSRHVDFTVLDEEMNYLLCIELDDPSHNRKESKETDRFKNYLFNTTGLRLYRVKTGTDYYKQICYILDEC